MSYGEFENLITHSLYRFNPKRRHSDLKLWKSKQKYLIFVLHKNFSKLVHISIYTNLKNIGRIETNENFEIFLQLVPIWVGGLLRKSCVCWTRYRLQEYISDCSVSKATRLVPCKCEHSYMNKAYLILDCTILSCIRIVYV